MAKRASRRGKRAAAKRPTARTAAPSPAAAAVLEWLIGGHTEAHIVGALNELFPAADPIKVAAEVQRLLIEEANPKTEALVGWLTLAYRDLYKRTREIGDFDGARKMLNELRRLHKL